MALRTKKDNMGFFIGCLGHPGCKHVVWLPSMIKEIKIHQDACARCGNRKFSMKFRQISTLAMLNPANAVDNLYISCFVCDSGLLSVLDIDVDSVRKSARSNTVARPAAAAAVPAASNNVATQRNRTQNPSTVRAPVPAPPAQRSNSNTRADPPNSWNNFDAPGRSNNSNNNRNAGDDEDVKCPNCQQRGIKYVQKAPIFSIFFPRQNLAAIILMSSRLTVRKEGPNKGRQFYKCPKEPPCNFFQWADATADSGSTSNAGSSNRGRNDNNDRAAGSSRSDSKQFESQQQT